MLLLSDQAGEVTQRDKEAERVGREVEEGRRGLAETAGRLLGGPLPVEDGKEMEIDARDDGTVLNDQTDRGAKDKSVIEDEDEDEDEDEGFEQVA
jgi:hypothetical protein